MPDVWQVFSCTPCSMTIARGGTIREHTCPKCGLLMEWLCEYSLET